ncbi:MAG: hypothetical protein ABWZ66_04825 [Pyrinomonadaceae bacterium]
MHDILNQQCSFLMTETTKREIKKMRDGLGYEDASELEKILIEQICANYLRVNLLEAGHAQKTVETHTTEAGLYWDKRLSSAQGRYLRACETLAKVRRLLAEANLRDEQARLKRNQSALMVKEMLENEKG